MEDAPLSLPDSILNWMAEHPRRLTAVIVACLLSPFILERMLP